jgi:predicted O-methyltransferase YrrM
VDTSLYFQLKSIEEYLIWERTLSQVDGHLTGIEGYTLKRLAETGAGIGEIVEIGSFMGKSTCCLAEGSKNCAREKVTAVDHFRGSPEHQSHGLFECEILVKEGTTFNKFMENLKLLQVDDYVNPIVARSEEAIQNWKKPIRLLFIDGDHSYDITRNDFLSWSPFVVKGGLIAFHDIDIWPGVTKFYHELINTGEAYMECLSVNTLRVIEKMEL